MTDEGRRCQDASSDRTVGGKVLHDSLKALICCDYVQHNQVNEYKYKIGQK